MDINDIFKVKDDVLTRRRSLPLDLWVKINNIKDNVMKERVIDILKILVGNDFDKDDLVIKKLMKLINNVLLEKLKYKNIIDVLNIIAPDYDNDHTKILNVEETEKLNVVNLPKQFDKIPEKTSKEQKQEFYLDFINSKVKNKEWLNKQVINKLHLIPKPDKDIGSYQCASQNFQHQIDIIFLPEDKKKYRYGLCVSDVHTRLFDVEPLSEKTSVSVIKALKVIYKRKVLQYPNELICDDGNEFKGQFITFCKENNIFLKALVAGKHIGQIDSKIKILGDALLKRQTANELLTNKSNVEWVDDIKNVIKLINEFTMMTYKPQSGLEHIDIKATGETVILPIGTKVRTMLFKPTNIFVNSDKLSGRFRSSDLRWNNNVSVITNIIILPNSPIMYSINDDDKHRWSRGQLQLITENEELPRLTKDKDVRFNKNKSDKEKLKR